MDLVKRGLFGLLIALGTIGVMTPMAMFGLSALNAQTSGQTTVGATIHPAGAFPVAGAGDVWLSSGFTPRTITDITSGASLEASITAIDEWAAGIRQLPAGGSDGQVLQISSGVPNWAGQAGIVTDQTLTGTGLANSPLGLAGVEFTSDLFNKLNGIEDHATADQTPAEIIAAIDTVLGSGWQTPGQAGTTTPGGLNEAAVNQLIMDYTGQANERADFASNRMPLNLDIIGRLYQSGGYRQYPATDIRLCGQPRSTAYTSVPGTVQCGSFTQARTDAFLYEPAFVLMRFDKSSFAASPVTADLSALRLRIVSDTPDDDPFYAITVQAALSNTSAYWWVSAQVPTLASGDNQFELFAFEPATLDILPPDGSITTAQLDGLLNARVGNIVTIGSDGALSSQVPGGLEQIKSGSFGVTVTSASRNSGLFTTALDRTVDLDAENQGIVFAEYSVNLPARSSNSIGWDNAGSARADVHGQVSLQQVESQPARVGNGLTNLGEVIVRRAINFGTTKLGDLVIRLQRDSATNEVGVNIRYEADAGHSRSGDNFSISVSGRLYLLAAGADSDQLGSVGSGYVFDTALPDAESYGEDSIAYVVTGAERGIYIKDTQITHGAADTGWAGTTVDPFYNLASDDATSGAITYTNRHANQNPFTDPRTGATIPANASGVAGLPTALRYINFSYVSPVHSAGQIEIVYSTTRTYTGDIELTTHGGGLTTDLLIPRVNATTWRLGGLSSGSISRLLAGQWTLTEPGHGDAIEVHSWVKVASTAEVELPDFNEITGGLPADRTISAQNATLTIHQSVPATAASAGFWYVIFTPMLGDYLNNRYVVKIDRVMANGTLRVCAQENQGEKGDQANSLVENRYRQVVCGIRLAQGDRIRLEVQLVTAPNSPNTAIVRGDAALDETHWVYWKQGN